MSSIYFNITFEIVFYCSEVAVPPRTIFQYTFACRQTMLCCRCISKSSLTRHASTNPIPSFITQVPPEPSSSDLSALLKSVTASCLPIYDITYNLTVNFILKQWCDHVNGSSLPQIYLSIDEASGQNKRRKLGYCKLGCNASYRPGSLGNKQP